jgi:hypothetical protein
MAYKPSRCTCESGITTEKRNVDYRTSRDDGQCCNDRVDLKESTRLDEQKRQEPYENLNKNNSSCECGESRTTPNKFFPKELTRHPIVNLCEPYVETVFFQYDSFPFTNNEMVWNNDKVGRIVKFYYYLDSSMGDAVTVYVEKISANKKVQNLLNTPLNGNNYIKGTFNTVKLEFHLNMKILNDEQIRIRFDNASSQDCTIMASLDIKYGEEDFFTKE